MPRITMQNAERGRSMSNHEGNDVNGQGLLTPSQNCIHTLLAAEAEVTKVLHVFLAYR